MGCEDYDFTWCENHDCSECPFRLNAEEEE